MMNGQNSFLDGTADTMRLPTLLIACLISTSCAIPLVERQAQFVESEYAPYAGEGTATICGQAVIQARRGEFRGMSLTSIGSPVRAQNGIRYM